MKIVFGPIRGLAFSDANVIGVISLIFWALTIVVLVKYITSP
jgi:KUP system potassium uptake protein